MKHESIEKKISYQETDLSFEEIYKKKWFPSEAGEEVKKANLLIIPSDYESNNLDVVFPETTNEFLDYLCQAENKDVICDIAISDDNFKRIEKHSALIDVATVIVQSGLLPIALNMISAFLYDLVSRYRRTRDNTSARVCIIAEKTKTKKSVKIEYEGPVSGIESLKDVIEKEFKE